MSLVFWPRYWVFYVAHWLLVPCAIWRHFVIPWIPSSAIKRTAHVAVILIMKSAVMMKVVLKIKKQKFFKIFQRNLWIKEAIIHCRKAQISEWKYSIQESVNSLTGVIAGLSMPCRLLSFSFLWFLHIHSTKIPAVVTRRQTDPTTAPIMISTEITNRIDILYIYIHFSIGVSFLNRFQMFGFFHFQRCFKVLIDKKFLTLRIVFRDGFAIKTK